MDRYQAHETARVKSQRSEFGYRHHVVMKKGGAERVFIVCSDHELRELQKQTPPAIWCGGYFNGAFAG